MADVHQTFTGQDRSILTFAFSPASQQLATAGDDCIDRSISDRYW